MYRERCPDDKLFELRREKEEAEAEEKELMEIYILKKKSNPTGIYELENEFCKILIINKNKWKTLH